MRECVGTWIAVVVLATSSASAVTFDVTRFDDPTGPCDNSGCSLRQAVLAANATAGADTITLHAGTYRLTLRGDDATAAAGDLDITDAVTIDGDSSGTTIIDAARARDRAFEVLPGGSLTLSNVTVKGGSATVDGGGIFSVGTLSVASSLFTRNKAGNSGGAIACEAGSCTLTDVIISRNKAVTNDGGACEFLGTVSATLLRVTMAGNTAKDTGGGMDSDEGASVSITDSTVSGNRSLHEGGGLDPSIGDVTLTNVTISGNRSAKGGGIQLESGGTLVLNHVTLARNRAKEGAGLWTEAGTTATLTGTLLAKNTPFDCFGPIVSNGSNLIGRVDGCSISGDTTGNLVGGPKPVKPLDPRIGPLTANGGTTQTHALLAGSPAINAVVGGCPPPATDQRGLPRSGTCDIGAFEVQ